MQIQPHHRERAVRLTGCATDDERFLQQGTPHAFRGYLRAVEALAVETHNAGEFALYRAIDANGIPIVVGPSSVFAPPSVGIDVPGAADTISLPLDEARALAYAVLAIADEREAR